MDLTTDSITNLVESSGVGLPPERPPAGMLINVVANQEWGKATIFDPEPELAPKSEEKIKTIRKSVISQSKDSVAKRQEEEVTLEDDKMHTSEVSDTDINTEDQIAFWCLPFFQSSMMATILEDTITELRILTECNNMLRITKTMADMDLLVALKYGVKQLENKDELAGIDAHNLGCLEYKLNKLIADRKNVTELFINLYREISTNSSFIPILNFITAVHDREEYVLWIEEETERNIIIRKELAKKLRLQRNHQKTVMYEVETLIDNLNSQLEDATLMTATKGRYVDNWQAARTEQHKQVLFEGESVYTDSTEYFKRRTDHESRVHAEVESLTNIIINETLEAIEHWMDKYETDMEKIDLKIQIQKSEYQNMYDKRVELDTLYAKRDKEIKAWNKFKEEREKEREYSNKMTKSAVTVQAWWRGLLVRKQLGPFRKRKARGKK